MGTYWGDDASRWRTPLMAWSYSGELPAAHHAFTKFASEEHADTILGGTRSLLALGCGEIGCASSLWRDDEKDILWLPFWEAILVTPREHEHMAATIVAGMFRTDDLSTLVDAVMAAVVGSFTDALLDSI